MTHRPTIVGTVLWLLRMLKRSLDGLDAAIVTALDWGLDHPSITLLAFVFVGLVFA